MATRELSFSLAIAAAIASDPIASARAVEAAPRIDVVARTALAVDLAKQIGGSRLRVELRRASGAAREPLFQIAGRDGFGADPLARSGAESHDPLKIEAVRATARDLAARLSEQDPGGAAAYAAGLARCDAALDRVRGKLSGLAFNYRGSSVFLTDPLGLTLVDALRFDVQDPAMAHANAPAAAADALREDIAERKASILIYDAQSKSTEIGQFVKLAKDSGVPTVGLRETLPSLLTWQEWKTREIDTIQGALNEAAP